MSLETITNLGSINGPFSSEIRITVKGETKLVFSNDKGDFGSLKIPTGCSPMFDATRFFFQIVNYTLLFFLTVVEGKTLVGEVRMFVLFDKGAMQGKILIRDNDGKLEFSLEDWIEFSFIPQDLQNCEESPLKIHNRDVWPIEGIDEEKGGIIAMLFEFGDKLFIRMIKLVFDEGTPTHERWMITLPRMPFWSEVGFDRFENVNFKDGIMMAAVIFQVKINGEWFAIQVIYQGQGGYAITNSTSLPLFATSTINTSLKTSSGKVVGEIYFLEELEDGSSISEYVFGFPA